jgi:GGDEF domain-containing protein
VPRLPYGLAAWLPQAVSAKATEPALYFCALEALQNVQKYAQASAATLRLRADGERLVIEIADDGRGFDAGTATQGAGLTNMEDRLDALGGTLHIESSPGVGTTLRATVPVTSAAPVARVANAGSAMQATPAGVYTERPATRASPPARGDPLRPVLEQEPHSEPGPVARPSSKEMEPPCSITGKGCPIADHPGAGELLRTGSAMGGRIDLDGSGPDVRRLIHLSGVTHSAYALVRVDGRARGILSAASRGRPIAEDLVERLGSLAHLTELALANALAHRNFQRQATVDALTDLCNRRGFDLALGRLSGHEPYAILAIDVDGLKAVNDRWGHGEGDRLIASVGAALAAVVRGGDTLARVGGDEFALLAVAASAHAIAKLEIRCTPP